MASSEDAESNSSVTEEFEHAYTCLPCETGGQNVRAVGYCVNCQEHLCQRCYDVHLIPSVMKRHVLLDAGHMLSIESDGMKSMVSGRCQQHEEEIINYHCPTHSFFGCHICCFKKERTCKDVQFIPEVSQNITVAKEFKEFNEKLTSITEKCTQLLTENNPTVESSAKGNTEAVTAMKEFKTEVLDALDKHEKRLLEEAKNVKQEETAKKNALTEKANAILKENQKIASKMEKLLNNQQNCDIYTAMVQVKDKLLAWEDELHAAKADKPTVVLGFRPNKDLLETLKSPFGFGKLFEAGTIAKVDHVMDIDCKTGTDTSNCRIIGSVFLPGIDKLVLTDGINETVKILDTRQNKVIADLKLPSCPLGVCQITETQVAVALAADHKLVFVETEPSLNIDREIKVNGQCRGVGYCEGKLVVSFYLPNKVEILDVHGTVLKKIETDNKGQNLFSAPYHLAINSNNNLIYVSNYGNSSIVSMKFDGTVANKYTDSQLKQPWQITFDSIGMVYVCGNSSHNVHQITEDCKKVKVILTSDQGMNYPESVSYSWKDRRFYIGRANVKVYQVSQRNT